jgi:AcrR family transcriptional regulator
MAKTVKKKTHHHGNLREALILAGIDILNEGGLTALTLRACASKTEVSHAAPAHHFKGLPGLLTAIAARGFKIFKNRMIEEREKDGSDPHTRLLAICRGYLHFAQENEALFSLMFTTHFEIMEDPDFSINAAAAYGVLAESCTPFEPLKVGARGTEVMIWSLVHGFASLQLSGSLGASDSSSMIPKFEDILPKLTLR